MKKHNAVVIFSVEREVSKLTKFLNFLMPENFVVIYLKLKQRGQTTGHLVKKMPME